MEWDGGVGGEVGKDCGYAAVVMGRAVRGEVFAFNFGHERSAVPLGH